ncbi:MAG: hypothetical protein J5852_02755, partial [Clostridia bacterium]|nr:hypothetical protein [Clostridia bacterium]
DYSADYFKPSPAMLEINEGAKGAYISYEDSSLKLLAGKTYQFTLNTRTVFGNPEFFFGFKTVGGVTGDSYSEISRNAAFLMYFNDEFEKTTYLRTISFTPKSDISDVCIKIGNISANNVSEVAVARAALYNIDSNSIVIGDNLLASMIKQNIKRNTAGQRIWNIVSAKEEDVAITVPADEMMFTLEKMIKIEPNNSWNRVQYYDTTFKLSANTTYRYTADFISFGGNPSFSCTYLDNNTQEYRKFSTISSSYTDLSDSETNIRGFEFTTKNLSSEELANIGELSITVGNPTEAVDVDCVFANPRFYVIKDGKPVGENLVTPITEDTVQYMGTMSYDAVWNLRYQSSSAIKLLDIPDNYFRIPAFVIKNANAVVSQTVTVKPDTYYKYSYYVKTAAGAVDTYIKSISPDGTQSDVKTENVKTDADGYYSYSGEFKTPASLKAENNLRVGFSFDNSVDGAVSNFQLYELNSGFEKTGANLIADGNFTEIKTVPAYTGADQIGWTIEGTEGDAGISARASGYFAIPTPKVFIFAGGSAGNALSHTATLEKDKAYTLSFNLKYANPGYEGDTGVDIAYSPDGSVWKVLDCEDVSPTNEFKKVYNFTMPADAGNAVNFKFSIRAGSDYVSGYIANAVLTDTANPSENLLSNGDFSNGLIGWNTTASFKCTFFADIPDGYFSNPQTSKPGMIVYRNSGAWENFIQIYLSLKPDTYYILKANSVHPWEPVDTSVHSIQMFGKDDEGNGIAPFLSGSDIKKCLTCGKFVSYNRVNPTSYTCNSCGHTYTEEEYKALVEKPFPGYTSIKVYHTIKNVSSNGNTHFRIVMQGGGNAGYWGDMGLYECTADGEILSDNILINGDFSLGETGWQISPTEKFNCRNVEQPANFFENYKRNGDKMIVSNGTAENAKLGQKIDVERDKTYYFSGFYVNMNAAGITPKVLYTTTDGTTEVAPVEFIYDSERFFFEGAFTLPDNAFSYRGKAAVDFVIDNTNKGKAYISDLAVYEEGKYENLFKNADFKDGFSEWDISDNYELSTYDSSVFRFYYDDSSFNNDNWADEYDADTPGEGKIGSIEGKVTND